LNVYLRPVASTAILKRATARTKAASTVELGSGSIFADLGYPDAKERQLRVAVAIRVNRILKKRELRQSGIVAVLGIPRPHVSELLNYKLNRFSVERLIAFLVILGHDVEIVIRHAARGRKAGTVKVPENA
jgi:predicted XRE-type DNA-binding protein